MDEQPVETTTYSLGTEPPAPERRADERHLSLFRVGSLIIDDRRDLCLIKNVSAGGMMIRAYCPIAEGARLSVELKHGQPIAGFVRWVSDDTVGVAFDEAIDILALLSSEEGPKPRMPRIEVRSSLTIRFEGAAHPAIIANISQGGMKVECATELPLGPEVVVSVAGLEPCRAIVRWRDGNSYGITFNRVLPLSELVAWLQEQRGELRAAG